MSLLLLDSFDHYTTSGTTWLGKWQTYASDPTVSATAGRWGTNGSAVFDIDQIRYDIPTPGDFFVVGMAMNMRGHAGANSILMGFLSPDGSEQCSLRQAGSGFLTATRSGTVLGTSTYQVPLFTWVYIEVKILIHDSAGTFEVLVEEIPIITVTGADTRTSASTADASMLHIGSTTGANGTNIWIDDLYILDDAGSAPTNDFLGDIRVECLFPSGNGNSSQFVGQDANSTDNYLLVDETVADADTTYVESPTVNDKDTYVYGNLTPTTGTVYGLQILPYAKKTDAGTREIVTVARLSGTETDGPAQTLSPSYQYVKDVREAKPGGGVWTISDVNSAEFGVKVSS